jgi:hypothetical protein
MSIRNGILAALLTLLAAGGAQAIGISQSLDKADIAYEDHAVLEIVVSWPGAQTSYIFDKPLQPQLENLRVQQYSSTVSSSITIGAEETTKKFSFTLVPTGSGTGRIAPVTVSYFSWPDSVPGQLVTEEMTLHIAASTARKGAVSKTLLPTWVWYAGGGALVLIIGIVVVLVVRGKKPKEVVKTPTEILLDRLTALKQASGSDLKRFQTGLYKDLVWYVTEAYHLHLAGLSTEDILHELDAAPIPDAEKDKICGWLTRADREKFSPLPPSPGETVRLEHDVREFFEKMIVRS